MDIKQIYREETDLDVYNLDDGWCFSNDYVKWLEKKLLIQRVVFNEAIENKITITLELNKPVTSKLSDWTDKSEEEFVCECDTPHTELEIKNNKCILCWGKVKAN